MDVYAKGFVTLLGVNCLFCALSYPLIRRKVPRNRVYGYRTCATLADDATWYEANARFGAALTRASVIAMALGGLLYAWPVLNPNLHMKAAVALMAGPVVVAILTTGRYLNFRRASRPS